MPRCKVCREPTTKRFGLTYLCGVEHAAQYAMAKRDKATAVDRRRAEKKSRSELRAMKIAVRPLKWYADKAREACHEYIRARDGNDPCISCRRHHDGQYHAGHYRPAGVNSSLRYDENNIHRQCAPCNSHLSGNLTNYRIGLIAKIGEEAVVALETS